MSDVITSTKPRFEDDSYETLIMEVRVFPSTAGAGGKAFRTTLNPAFRQLSQRAYNRKDCETQSSYGVYLRAFSSHLAAVDSKRSALLDFVGSRPLSMTTQVTLRIRPKSRLRTILDSLRTRLGMWSSGIMDLTITTTLNELDETNMTQPGLRGWRIATQTSFNVNFRGCINNGNMSV